MDPQSAAFTPRDDFWRFQADMLRVQQTQVEHADRLSRLERRQEDDARMKSVWGTSSPFPGILSGTPNQGPLHNPPTDAFSGFDDHSLIGSLHLDADEEPRRTGATSRANSVRFDESANQSHWSHPPRTSMDFMPRSSSSLGSHPMMERTYSHKSDGRQSSAGQSVHSATSGRANSLGLDTPFSVLGTSPMEVPGLSPGLFVLGTVPSIIRCWLNDNFKHDSLLYAAVCTGSYVSYLDERLVSQLGYASQVREEVDRKIKLPVYFPEATTRSVSSRPNSPAPQLPSIIVDFTVISTAADGDEKSVQIFVGSDVLRAHNGDVLFSSNQITLFDDQRCKLSIPLVRPEDDRTFRDLRTISDSKPMQVVDKVPPLPRNHTSPLNGLRQTPMTDSLPQSLIDSPALRPSSRVSFEDKPSRLSFGDEISSGSTSASLEMADTRPIVNAVSTEGRSPTAEKLPTTAPSRPTVSSNPWRRRRDSMEKPVTQTDPWGRTGTTYQRREQGIKVLRPTKPISRTASATDAPCSATSPTVPSSQSRFFNDGSRRVSLGTTGPGEGSKDKAVVKEGGKTKSANPVGGASAFSWLSK